MASRSARLLLALPAVLALAGCSLLPGPSPTVTVTVTEGADGAAPSVAASDAGTSAAPTISAAPQLTTACQLLTLKEAEAVVGTTLSAGQEGLPTDPSCTYNPDPKGTRTAQVFITTGLGAKNTFDTDTRIKHTFTSVPGLGDESHQEQLAIYFRKGTEWAGISLVYLDDPAKVKVPLQQAAKVIASRLP